MKYCVKCGCQMDDSAAFCPKCGAPCSNSAKKPNCAKCGCQIADDAAYCPNCGAPCSYAAKKPNTVQLIAEIFMILGCISSGWALIPLCWTIPMTVKYFRSVKEGRDVGTGFKVCSLIFVNFIAGILMLVGDEVED